MDRLAIAAGVSPAPGSGATRHGSLAVSQPEGAHASLQGVVAALAVGHGSEPAGQVAADLCIQQFVDAHASMDPLRGVKRNGITSLSAIGRWLHAHGGAGTSFTGLVLRGRQAHVFHVGGGHLYRLRDGQIVRLTPDRTRAQPSDFRGLGTAQEIPIDYAAEPLRAADRFMLCSDAIQAKLPDRCIRDLLGADAAVADIAAHVTRAAAGGADALALVIDTLSLPESDPLGADNDAQALPVMPPPRAGAVVDRFRLEAMLSDGQYSRVFRAIDETDGRVVVVKFPKDSVSAEPALRQAFLREAWIAARVASPFLAEVIEVQDDRRTALYTVMPFYEGETLEQRLRRWPQLSRTEGLAIARKLARAIAMLHRHHIIHRDIKPDNVVLTAEGGLRLLDFGVARLPNLQDIPGTGRPGTPSYMAPELLAGAEGNERTDLYALGVTIYRMFSGAYPFGEIEPFSRPRFTRPPTPLATLRPDLPGWLDRAVQRTVAVKPDERPADVLELLHALDDPAGATAAPPPYRSLLDRNPVLFWQVVSLLLAAALIVVLAWPASS